MIYLLLLAAPLAYFPAYGLHRWITRRFGSEACSRAALVLLLVSVPLLAFLCIASGYFVFVLGPFFALALPLFAATLAGRRPFLWSIGAALLFALVFAIAFYRQNRDAVFAEEVPVMVGILGIGLVGGLLVGGSLFLLGRRTKQAI